MKEKYLHYNTTDLVCDEDFIKWIRFPDPEADKKWSSWLEENPDKKEEFEEAARIINSMQFKEIKIPIDKDRLWDKIRDSNFEKPADKVYGPARSKNLQYIAYISAAAGIALVILFTFLWSGTQDFVTSGGEIITIQLPDQSSVQMNELSRIAYNPGKWDKRRTLTLSGEAFFSVEPGVPFSINTELGSVEVVGTSFNVLSREGNFQVHCHSGQVKVILQFGTDSTLLSAGEYSDLTSGFLQKEFFDPTDHVDWLPDIFRFENQPLRSVFQELELQFGIEVQAEEEILNRIYTGFFTSDDLNEALQSICWPMQLQFNKNGDTIVITSSTSQ